MTMTPNRTPCSTCPGSSRDRRAWVGGVRVTWLLVVLLVFMGPFVAAGGLYAWWAIARGIALAEQGKRKNGRWEYGANVSNETISRKAMMQAGLVIDHDTAHGTDYAQRVLLGELTLDQLRGNK